jgi:hypothetical protein
MTAPCPRLEPLLLKHGIDWHTFSKKGRPATGVREKREAIVTELHEAGTPWLEMAEITGLSLMGVHRLTKAIGNAASRENRRKSAAASGHARKGEKKPWLASQLKDSWAAGKFDFHRGRVRSEEEHARIIEGWSDEVRAHASQIRTALWEDPSYRDPLVAFHRSPEERARRSREQARRVAEDPEKWARGRGSYVDVRKCAGTNRLWVRSTYEAEAVRVLEADAAVSAYAYEARLPLPDGTEILPDFVVHRGGETWLVEVKASWVFGLPPHHKVAQRLARAQNEAANRGWVFHIWTEKDVLHAVR